MALAGAVLSGRYVLDQQIGNGGYGEVWHATDNVLSRPVAVKLLHSRYAQRNDALQGFSGDDRRWRRPERWYPLNQPAAGSLHHIELWVPDLARACQQWGWLLGELGYEKFQDWEHGRSWRLGGTYLVIEQSPALSAADHDRLRPGMNHLAFHAGDRVNVDALTAAAPAHGWTLLFPETHPYAGGMDNYAAYLANTDGFEVELVAQHP